MPGEQQAPHPIELAKRKAKAIDALDLMGSLVGRRIYDPARETLVLRVGFWLSQGWATADDVCEACEAMTTPAALAKIKGEWDMNADIAAAVERIQERKAIEAERRAAKDRKAAEDAEARKWEEGHTIRQRAAVLKLLAGVGTQVGRGRPTPTVNSGDEDQTAEQTRPEAEAPTGTEAEARG